MCFRACVAGLAMKEIVSCWPVNDFVRFHRYVWQYLKAVNTSGGLSQDFAASGQNRVTAKTKFEPVRATAQRVILLLPSLINNIYFVICIRLIQSYLRLRFHLSP